jgi:hypothetical protein
MSRDRHVDLLAEISISHDVFAGTLSPFGPIWTARGVGAVVPARQEPHEPHDYQSQFG